MSNMCLLLLAAQARLDNLEKRTLRVRLGNAINPDALYSFRRLVLWYGGGDGPTPNPQSWAIRKSVTMFGKFLVANYKKPEEDQRGFITGTPAGSEVKIVFSHFEETEGLGPLLEYIDTIASIATKHYLPVGAKPFDRGTIIRTALLWWDIQLINKGLLP